MFICHIKAICILFIATLGLGCITGIASEQAQILKALQRNEPTVFLVGIERSEFVDPIKANYVNSQILYSHIYATPIDKAPNGRLSSVLLEKFTYRSGLRTAYFTLNGKALFSDGSQITAKDIEMAIKRVLLQRPTDPLLSKIAGSDQWLKLSRPLAHPIKGISVSGNQLTILFTEDYRNALDCFADTSFSVIPSRCIDLNSNVANCVNPVFSGRYHIVESTDQRLTYARRIDDKAIIERVHQVHVSPGDLHLYLAHLKSNHVVIIDSAGVHGSIRSAVERSMKLLHYEENSLHGILLNPYSSAFRDKRVRQLFSIDLREEVKSRCTYTSSSVMGRMMPGYMSSQRLADKVRPFTNDERQMRIEQLRVKPPIMMESQYESRNFLYSSVQAVFAKWRVKPAVVKTMDETTRSARWFTGDVSMRSARITFAAPDVIFNFKRILSREIPNHPLLFINSDSALKALMKDLDLTASPSNIARIEEINSYLYEDAKLVVLGNDGSMVYASNDTKAINNVSPLPKTYLLFKP